MLKIKPWWLRVLTPAHTWVTIAPHIYYPAYLDTEAFPALVQHEQLHLRRQQSIGRRTWLWKYFTSRTFRLHEETMAMAVEIWNTPDLWSQQRLLLTYSNMLTKVNYFWAAKTFDVARIKLLEEVDKLSAHWQANPQQALFDQ